MAKKLKLGIIGMSEGNGHPYSWGAIFNGYDKEAMEECPFSVIPKYLAKQRFPEDSIKNASVTHIWTQKLSLSKKISKASLIPNICINPEDMIGEVDAVLLARDDAENHYSMSLPFIKAGLPIFIDKPLAYDLKTAKEILNEQQYDDQIFTCSSTRFSNEFNIDKKAIENLGSIEHIDAFISNSWKKYAIHIIEPSLNIINYNHPLVAIKKIDKTKSSNIDIVNVVWENNITATFKTFNDYPSPFKIIVFGQNDYLILEFSNSFYAFKNTLSYFLGVINKNVRNIDRTQTLQIIEIIERGTI